MSQSIPWSTQDVKRLYTIKFQEPNPCCGYVALMIAYCANQIEASMIRHTKALQIN